MKKKWLCFALFLCLLLWPLSGLPRLQERDRLARSLTAQGARCSRDALMALGRAALWRAQETGTLLRALEEAFPKRTLTASARAREAARELLDAGK